MVDNSNLVLEKWKYNCFFKNFVLEDGLGEEFRANNGE